MFCGKCGEPIIEDSSFCSKCGSKITENEETKTGNNASKIRPLLGQHNNAKSNTVKKKIVPILISLLCLFIIVDAVLLGLVIKKSSYGKKNNDTSEFLQTDEDIFNPTKSDNRESKNTKETTTRDKETNSFSPEKEDNLEYSQYLDNICAYLTSIRYVDSYDMYNYSFYLPCVLSTERWEYNAETKTYDIIFDNILPEISWTMASSSPSVSTNFPGMGGMYQMGNKYFLFGMAFQLCLDAYAATECRLYCTQIGYYIRQNNYPDIPINIIINYSYDEYLSTGEETSYNVTQSCKTSDVLKALTLEELRNKNNEYNTECFNMIADSKYHLANLIIYSDQVFSGKDIWRFYLNYSKLTFGLNNL